MGCVGTVFCEVGGEIRVHSRVGVRSNVVARFFYVIHETAVVFSDFLVNTFFGGFPEPDGAIEPADRTELG